MTHTTAPDPVPYAADASHYCRIEGRSAQGARELCRAYAEAYARLEVDAAVVAALVLALEQELRAQGKFYKVTFGTGESE